jgi:hypothetical protein
MKSSRSMKFEIVSPGCVTTWLELLKAFRFFALPLEGLFGAVFCTLGVDRFTLPYLMQQ